MASDRRECIRNMPRPRNVRGVRQALGLFNYCRQYIPEYTTIVEPLQKLVTGTPAPLDSIDWGPEQEHTYTQQALTSAPALGIPSPNKPFHLYHSIKFGCYNATLMQEHGGKMRPIAYYSTKQNMVSAGMPACMAAIDCAAWAVAQTEPLNMGGSLIVHTPHTIISLLNSGQLKHVTDAQRAKWETYLLPQLVQVVHDTGINPSERILTEGEPHQCDLEGEIQLASDINTEPLEEGMTLYVDGSRCIENGKPHTGWAVLTSDEVVASGLLPGHQSAQVAELHTLTQACVFGANSSMTIYTDSLYAFGVVHDYSSSLERLGYVTTGGGAIKNYEYVQRLVATTKFPTRLAVVKIKAHQTGVDPHVLANRKADEAAKAAARQPVPKPHAPIATVSPDEMDIRQLHAQSETAEIAKWQQVGAR
ncbi:Retrovirus-related Pol polyprotein from transposon opus [Acipenser ruthenus]|uniref:Retrovirus-related Pol polyprotein from transposon opus n=1 Tax=Acipenser ruthenus TaxID=7906 RepID=A0A444V3D7_ACIRT|nr:Retrovirus-related Pol polyprotein from transposon opus [Acipenser ruthenus]